jgi:D-alanyl-D-alanine carboxypeptidase/D-alanyl-D-alanine-endopeptidase (penicillin-binding protein 4)
MTGISRPARNGCCRITVLALAAFLLFLALPAEGEAAGVPGERVARLAGKGAVLAVAADGEVLVSHRPDEPLVPASVLKIVTAAAALEELGPGYRFETLFRRTPDGDLVVSSRGDPHLVSEELARVAGALRSRGLERVRDVLVDNRYFQPGLVLHGTNRSLNPYDAYNGAFCVNFNTICVEVDDRGRVRSAEPQTPLTGLARRAALACGARGRVRINLAESPDQCLAYAGELLAAFLRAEGIAVEGRVRPCSGDPEAFPLVYTHHSSWTLEDLLRKTFRYSNNFMANQIFLSVGASRYGPPATPEKARRAVARFLESAGIEDLHVEEGSGLSRRTRLTANQMVRVLERFRPHRHLLDCEAGACAKTGTLHDVKSLAGYLASDSERPVAFVILLNGKEHGRGSRERIFSLLRDRLPPS